MRKIKVLIIIDVAPRDLKECCLVGYALMEKHHFEVIFSTTKNEKSEMMRHKPHAIILSHVQYERFTEVVRFARDMGVKICIMPPEGIPAFDEAIPSIYGSRKFLKDIDLFLSWGPHVTSHLQKYLPNAHIRTVGCARFDTYQKKYLEAFKSRHEFFKKHDLNPAKPLVTWVSSGGYLQGNPEEQMAKNEIISDLGKKSWNLERILSQRLTFKTIKSYLGGVLARQPDFNVAYRPHPLEGSEVIESFIEKYPQVKVIPALDPLEETLLHSDVYLGFPCTAAIESWAHDPYRQSLFVRDPNLKVILKFQHEVMSCAETASSFGEFEEKLKKCILKTPVDEEKITQREKLIEKYLFKIDGSSAQRCADAIAELIYQKKVNPKWPLKYVSYGLSMIRNRMLFGHWLSLKRPPKHHKYFPSTKIKNYLSWIGRVHNKAVSGKLCRIDI